VLSSIKDLLIGLWNTFLPPSAHGKAKNRVWKGGSQNPLGGVLKSPAVLFSSDLFLSELSPSCGCRELLS